MPTGDTIEEYEKLGRDIDGKRRKTDFSQEGK